MDSINKMFVVCIGYVELLIHKCYSLHMRQGNLQISSCVSAVFIHLVHDTHLFPRELKHTMRRCSMYDVDVNSDSPLFCF